MVLGVLTLFGCDSRPPAPDSTKIGPPSHGSLVITEDFERENPKWHFAEGTWKRRQGDDTGWVLAQTSTSNAFCVALLEDQRFSDLEVSGRFRPISGREDASAGIVFRARDVSNYMLVRANALEDNFRLYTVVGGKRSQIASTEISAPALGKWHTLRVVAAGDHIQAYLNGELLIDYHEGTFKEGWVGLWTKADSVTEFDDLRVIGVAVK